MFFQVHKQTYSVFNLIQRQKIVYNLDVTDSNETMIRIIFVCIVTNFDLTSQMNMFSGLRHIYAEESD